MRNFRLRERRKLVFIPGRLPRRRANPHASGFFSNPVIGKLLSHSKTETTARDSAQEAAERVAESIEEDLLGEG